jgi:hypothetical protein
MPGIERKPPRDYDEIPFRREWGCPYTKNRTPWCFGLCIPNDGIGACGRIAPHSLIGRTERAIMRYKEAQAAASRKSATE